MKRHICAGAGALVLALAGAGTATAGGLPILGGQQQGVQSASLGDQSVGEQSNTADVTQRQGSFNVNVSPAIAILGDASTENAQGNGNTAVAGVGQSNEASQSQTVDQAQRLAGGSGGCCASGGQEASQSAEGGDQSVGEQKNDAGVTQEQGNGNVNISPAIAIGGDASTHNEQGNGNTAIAFVDQANSADQSQDVAQKQSVTSGGGCCGASSQSAEQTASGGDQSVDKQKNEADVTQEQGNGNLNISPAIAIGGGKEHDSCGPCSKGKGGDGGSSASTWNAQGNGNKAVALVGQSNSADQSQDVAQKQTLTSDGGCCVKPHKPYESNCKTPKQPEHLCGGTPGRAAEQSVWGGDQSVGKQKNEADVTQEQGNGNENRAPAIAFGGKKHDSCSPCSKDKGGDESSSASTWNAQGNGNKAVAGVSQGNTATQSQSVWQGQRLIDACKEVMRW
jgi:hypothetical protein